MFSYILFLYNIYLLKFVYQGIPWWSSVQDSALPLQGCVCLDAQSCPTLCDPIDCRLPGSSVHGILQARILEGLPFPPPGDILDPGIKPTSAVSPALQEDSLCAEPSGKPLHGTHVQSLVGELRSSLKTDI